MMALQQEQVEPHGIMYRSCVPELRALAALRYFTSGFQANDLEPCWTLVPCACLGPWRCM